MPDESQLSIYQTDDYKSLLSEQKIAFCGALKGVNALITGGGGVGKSHLICILERHIPQLVLTATTGIASLNIGGQTLDRFFGFGSSMISPEDARKMSPDVFERLALVKSLLVDEASMLRIDKFECMDQRLQAAKKNTKPFGGVQLILVGDFCQLTPILGNNKTESESLRSRYGRKLFCFESDVYQSANITPYLLSNYVRMGDERQRQLLRNLRMGAKVNQSVSELNSLAKGDVSSDALYLCPTNAHVDKINEEGYAKLTAKKKTYFGVIKKQFLSKPVAEVINLKVGCRVMISANNQVEGYYNGDLGTVTMMNDNKVSVELDRGSVVVVCPYKWEEYTYKKLEKKLNKSASGTFEQIPLKLAYAVTIHKSQGMTLNEVIIDLSGGGVSRPGTFAAGQAYVALSRVRTLDKMKLVKKLNSNDIKMDRRAINFTANVSLEALKRRKDDILDFNIEKDIT